MPNYIMWRKNALMKNAQVAVTPSGISLSVTRYTSDTYVNSTTYTNDSFIMITVYGTGDMSCTYGIITKSATGVTSSTNFYFGKYMGYDDGTPISGTLTLEGDGITSFGQASYNVNKVLTTCCRCVNSVIGWGSVTIIGLQLFAYNSMSSYSVPSNITNIYSGAFLYCSSLVSVTFANASIVTLTGNNVFESCTALETCNLGDTITSITGESFFTGCTSLTTVHIPTTLTYIPGGMFYNCTSLASITIPNSVTIINGSAFYHCTSLTSITIPNSVTIIVTSAFSGCTSLTQVSVGSGVTSINNSAFLNCGSSTNKTVFHFYSTTPPTLGTTVFTADNIDTIYVPSASLSAYQSATNWSDYASYMVGE